MYVKMNIGEIQSPITSSTRDELKRQLFVKKKYTQQLCDAVNSEPKPVEIIYTSTDKPNETRLFHLGKTEVQWLIKG